MYSLLAPALFASLVAAHGHVTNIVINGVSFDGWDINSYPYEDSPPTVVAWGTPNTANGFIAPDAYATSDIICHLNATNAKGHAVVAAGDKVFIQWSAWPDSHHGPVIDYLASCGSSGCETVDKTTLEFFKIDGVGLINDTTVPGTWADDELIAQGSGWMVEIPPDIAPGDYVLRHELIALHSAGTEDGAQNYPQCFNLQITGTGSDVPAGTLGTELYSSTDAGILVNIYESLSTYVVPGPTLYSGAVSLTQTTSAITATGTPVTGTGSATGAAATTSASEAATTTLATTTSAAAAVAAATTISTSEAATTILATTASVAAITSSAKAITTTLATTTRAAATSSSAKAITTTLVTTTSQATTTAASGGDGTTQSLYGQCGGINWTGATACASPAACSSSNPYYSQCVASAA